MSKIYTKEERFRQLLNLNTNYTFETVVWPFKARDKISVNCHEHGLFLIRFDSLISGSGCPECGKIKKSEGIRKPIEDKIKLAKFIHGNKYNYDLLPSSFTYDDKVKITCHEHGEFEQEWSNHISGNGCPECGKIKNKDSYKRSFNYRINKANLFHNGKYSYIKLPIDFTYRSIVDIVCPIHGEFKKEWNSHIAGTGCPKCKPISKLENEIFDYIKSFYFVEIKRAYRPEWMFGKELDIYIPEFNFAIEFNGLYWHSEKHKNKYYHFNKTKLCRENDVILLHIWSDDWQNILKKSIYKSKIKHFLKMDNLVYGRKCKIKEIEKDLAISFIRENHLEGIGILYKNSKFIGLFFEDQLLMVAIVGEFYNQSSKSFELKLQRIATKQEYTVVGGVSKISKYIRDNIGQFKFQITLDTGGTLVTKEQIVKNNVSLRYWWTDGFKKINRNQTQVSILKENSDWLENDTEVSYMERNGWFRVWDSGILEI